MNRREWYAHWRSVREARPKSTITSSQIISALKELYDYGWTPEQEAFIRLCGRYKGRVSQRCLDQIEAWRPEARARAQKYFQNLIYSNNPFLDLIPKGNVGFEGKYIPVPL